LHTAGCWRGTEAAAIAAVEKSREARRADGEEIAEDARWGPADYLEAAKARLPTLKGALFVFKAGIGKLNRLLWPSSGQPEMRESTEAISAMLRAAPRRVDHLLDSAVRAGAQTALMLVRSWYPGLDLSVLTGMRVGSDEDVSSVWPDICHRAAEVKSHINPYEYTPYLDSDGNPLEMATYSDLVYSTSSSSDAGVKPGGSRRTTSSSGEYAMSDSNAEGGASSGQPEGQATARRDEDVGTSQPGPAEGPPAPQAEPRTSEAPPTSGDGAVPPA